MTGNPFRVGIIGVGIIADKLDDVPPLAPGRIDLPWTHAPAYHMIPDTQIVAVADVNEKAMAEFARRWEIPSTYTDYRQMLEREKLDIVSVLTPNFFHYEMTIAAAEAGVGVVFCEVPMCTSLDEADRMIEACRKSGTQLVVDLGSGRWWAREYVTAKEIIDTGGIVTMTTSITGGLVLNGTSMLDMLRFYANSEVTEVLELWKANKESHSREMLNHPFPQRNVARAARVAIIERMVAHLRGEEGDISNGADGRAAMEIALAFYESHDTGGWAKLPLTDTSRQVKVLHGARAWE